MNKRTILTTILSAMALWTMGCWDSSSSGHDDTETETETATDTYAATDSESATESDTESGAGSDTNSDADTVDDTVSDSTVDSATETGSDEEVCPGCARLSVPFADSMSEQGFIIEFPEADLTHATITFRVKTYKGFDGSVQIFTQGFQVNSTRININTFSDWTDITFVVPQIEDIPSDGLVTGIGLFLAAYPGNGAIANPTVIYVDSVTVTGGTEEVGPWNFDSDAEAIIALFNNPEFGTTYGSEVTHIAP